LGNVELSSSKAYTICIGAMVEAGSIPAVPLVSKALSAFDIHGVERQDDPNDNA